MKLYYPLFFLICFLLNKSYALENNTLRVCTTGDFFPFESKTPDGRFVGFDIDMMEAFSASVTKLSIL